MKDPDQSPICDCRGELMTRDYASERANIGDREYRSPIVSDSLAVSPAQITEHKRHFPDIEMTPEGQLVFRSYRQHDDYLKKIGATKNRQKIRKRRGNPK